MQIAIMLCSHTQWMSMGRANSNVRLNARLNVRLNARLNVRLNE